MTNSHNNRDESKTHLLSEKGHSRKSAYCMIPFICSSKRDKICSDRNPKVAAFGDMTGSQGDLTGKRHKGTFWDHRNILDAALWVADTVDK